MAALSYNTGYTGDIDSTAIKVEMKVDGVTVATATVCEFDTSQVASTQPLERYDTPPQKLDKLANRERFKKFYKTGKRRK